VEIESFIAKEELRSREMIRKRPGMYIGGTGHTGVTHLIWELVGNSVDQVLAGRASEVQINIHKDGSIEVVDDGPGMNLLDERVRSYFLEWHSEPTADAHSPHIHVAQWGVGLSVPTALSTRLTVTTRFEGQTLRCDWTDGGDKGGQPEVLSEDTMGTRIRMWLDPAIFDDVAVPPGALDRRIYELNALIPALSLNLSHSQTQSDWQSGMASLFNMMFGRADESSVSPLMMNMHDDSNPFSPIDLQICLGVGGESNERIAAFGNFRRVLEEGAFIRSIRAMIWQVGRDAVNMPVPPEPAVEPLRGLMLLAHVTMLSPEWSGPTKGRLDDPRSVAIAEKLIAAELPSLIRESPRLEWTLKRAFDEA